MMSLSFQYAFANSKWTTEIDVMLEKMAGVRKIHLMRTIGKVQADFNQALKIPFPLIHAGHTLLPLEFFG